MHVSVCLSQSRILPNPIRIEPLSFYRGITPVYFTKFFTLALRSYRNGVAKQGPSCISSIHQLSPMWLTVILRIIRQDTSALTTIQLSQLIHNALTFVWYRLMNHEVCRNLWIV